MGEADPPGDWSGGGKAWELLFLPQHLPWLVYQSLEKLGGAGSDLRARLKIWKVDGVEGAVQPSTFLFPILSNPIC